MTPSTKTETNLGRITQIIGPVLDVAFAPNKMPNIYNALVVEGKNDAGDDIRIVAEVQQLLGDNLVRAVSMSATDGLMRGMTVVDTGAALSVPVGKTTLGRIFNVLGDPVDELGPCTAEGTLPIHRNAPAFVDLDTELSIFETGIIPAKVPVTKASSQFLISSKVKSFSKQSISFSLQILIIIQNL